MPKTKLTSDWLVVELYSRFYIKCLKLCYTLRGGVVILYATVRAAVAAHTHCRLCSLRRSANKVIVTY